MDGGGRMKLYTALKKPNMPEVTDGQMDTKNMYHTSSNH